MVGARAGPAARGRAADGPPRRREAASHRLPRRGGAGAAGGYRLGAGAKLPPLLLDDAEAVAIAVGLRSAASGSIGGTQEPAVRALAKLEQLLPERLRAQVAALAATTSAFAADGPAVDPDLLTTLATACRERHEVTFAYAAKQARARRRVDPAALVHSGARWYLVAHDHERDDWRTFRVDRIDGEVEVGGRATVRAIPGGDAAAFVALHLDLRGEQNPVPGRVRVHAPAATIAERVPPRQATVEPETDTTCVVTSTGRWSRSFLVWCTLLDHDIEVLGPPELRADAQLVARRLAPPPRGIA